MEYKSPLRPEAVALFALVGALAVHPWNRPRPDPPSFSLFQKGSYQVLRDHTGAVTRLLHDVDGDGRAETVVFFEGKARPVRAESDADRNGVVETWEHFDLAGRVRRRLRDTTGDGRADLVSFLDENGRVVREEIDRGGDPMTVRRPSESP
jgi:hypothetical protein